MSRIPRVFSAEGGTGGNIIHYFICTSASDYPDEGTYNIGDMLYDAAANSLYFAASTAGWTSTAGQAGTVYAATGASYLTWKAEGGLTAEKVLTAGSSVTIHTDATAIYIDAITGGAAAASVLPFRDFPFVAANAVVWTNMPAAATEFFGNTGCRQYLTLTNATSIRGVVTMVVTGVVAANFEYQASTDGGTTWQAFVSATTSPLVNIGAGFMKSSNWLTFNMALTNLNIVTRIWGNSGNGTVDPSFSHVSLQVC